MNFIDLSKIAEIVQNKDFYKRNFVLFLGVTLLALEYNLFLLPDNLVIGGMSGLAIIFKELIGFDPTIFLYLSTVILLGISFIFLGKKETSRTIIGSILYPIMVSVTLPLAEFLKPHMTFDSILVIALLCGLLSGFANGIIFKSGFTTGGSDIIMKIINKYAHISEGKSSLYTNIIIILGSGFIFGMNKMIYSIIILYISTALIDRILIGISNSKQFLIFTKETEKIQEFIIKELKSGVTMIETTGGYRKESGKLLICVVNTKDYYYFKETVLIIDPEAFFVINDCYEVSGGVNRSYLPFKKKI